MQGQSNEDYRSIIAQIQGVLFLSTPHRGTNLAEMLNRILSVSILTNHAPKHYLAELRRNSLALEDLNESFRNFASKLQIFSFYETLQTSVGPKSLVRLMTAVKALVDGSLLADDTGKRLLYSRLPR